jgi:guanine deaminase
VSRPEARDDATAAADPLGPTALAALMADAVDFCVRHVNWGGLPFVGVVIDDRGYVSEYGVNQVQQSGDPSAHAEIVAMRAALHQLSRTDLRGMYLLATGEPCGLCYRFALDHSIDRIYVAVDVTTVAAMGFDYRTSYRAFDVDRAQLSELVVPLPVADGLKPFERYLSNSQSGRGVATPPPESKNGPS